MSHIWFLGKGEWISNFGSREKFSWIRNLSDFPSIKLFKRHSRYPKYAVVSIFLVETFENQACGVKFLKHDSKSESISCW